MLCQEVAVCNFEDGFYSDLTSLDFLMFLLSFPLLLKILHKKCLVLKLSFEMKEMIFWMKMNNLYLELNELMVEENTVTVECIQGHPHLSSASSKYITVGINLKSKIVNALIFFVPILRLIDYVS